jgi:hypothetical protein
MEQSDEDCRKLILNLIHLLSDHVELHQADERDLDEARKMVKQMINPTLDENSLKILIKAHNSLYPKEN